MHLVLSMWLMCVTLRVWQQQRRFGGGERLRQAKAELSWALAERADLNDAGRRSKGPRRMCIEQELSAPVWLAVLSAGRYFADLQC